MKVLITTLVTLAVGTAMAAPSTSATLPSSGTSTTALENVKAKKSPLSLKWEFTNEKSQESLSVGSKDLETANEFKLTYKLTDTQSLRGSAYIQTLTREKEDDVRTNLYYLYLQYTDSSLFKIGDRAFSGAIRQYTFAFGDAHDSGLESITRLYLSTDFKVNNRVTVTPLLNPRIYWGSQARLDTGAPKVDYLGILETQVNVSDKVSYVLDLIHRERTTEVATNGRFEIDNWVTVALADRTAYTERIALDAGFYNTGNSGNGVKLHKDKNTYYVRANVNF